jgi:hypothetical protein
LTTAIQVDAYILKYPAQAVGRVTEEEIDAPEGDTLREHLVSGIKV